MTGHALGRSIQAGNEPTDYRHIGERGMGSVEWVNLGSARPERKERAALLRHLTVADEDPSALRRLRALREVLEHEAALIDEAILLGKREQGYSWAELGESFGMTREAMFQRFANRLGLRG